MTDMHNSPENVVQQTLSFLKPMSLLPSIIGLVVLLSPLISHLVHPKDWKRELFVWVGIPLEPKIVYLGGYAVIFGTTLVLISVAMYLAKNTKCSVLGKTPIGGIVTFVMIGSCGVAGLYLIQISQKLPAAVFLTLPIVWLVGRLVCRR